MTNYANLYKVIYMNVVLTFHLSLSLSLASLLPQIAEQNHYSSLGQIAIISIYSVNLLFNLLGPSYLTKLSYKVGFTLQALLSVPCFIPATILSRCDADSEQKAWYCETPVLSVLLICGCVCLGSGLGGYFILQNSYVSDCSSTTNQEVYFGIAYMLLGAAYLLSGLASEQLLDVIGRDDFFLYAGAVQLCLSLLFAFVQQPKQQLSKLEPVDINENLSTLTPTSTLAIANTEFAKLKVTKQIYIMYSSAINNDMISLLPMYLTTGCVIGFEFGFFYKFINASLPQDMPEVEINKKTARIFLVIGVAQVCSGIYNGFMKSIIGSLMNSIVYVNIFKVMLIALLLNSYIDSYFINYVVGFLIGFTDNSGQFSSVVIISERWPDSMCVFGIYLFCQNFGVILINGIAVILEGLNLQYHLVFLFALQCCVTFSQQHYTRKQSNNYQ